MMDRKSYEVSFGDIVLVNPGHTGFQWPISPNLFKITTKIVLIMDRKSYMRFHLVLLSLTLSDFERSIQVTGFQWPIFKSIQDNHEVTVDDG